MLVKRVTGGDGADDHEHHQREHEAEVAAGRSAQEPLEPGLPDRRPTASGAAGCRLRCGADGRSARGLIAHAAVPFMTRSSTPCSSIWFGGYGAQHAAVGDDEHGVGEAEHLLDLARDDDDGVAGCGEAADEGVDLGAGADVDASRRLVEQQHPRAVHEPAREQDLLLVAAREGRSRPSGSAGRSSSASICSRAALRSARSSRKPAFANRDERRERDVDEDRLLEHQALALALLGREADAGVDCGDAPSRAQALAADLDGARRSRCARRTRSRGSRIVRSRRGPASPTTSPARTVKLTSSKTPAQRRGPRPRARPGRPSGTGRPGGKTFATVRPVMSRISSGVGVSATGSPLAIAAAVLEHRDAVADLADLFEPVGDVDDGDALRRSAPARRGRGSSPLRCRARPTARP